MLLFLALLLFSSSAYSMIDHMGRWPQNNEKVFQDCKRHLQEYDNFIPGFPSVGLIVEHPRFLELMGQIANQDALWIQRPERVINLLVSLIENRGNCFLDKAGILQVLDIFLIAAAKKGHTTFINSTVAGAQQSLLGVAIHKNNLECTKKILACNASLDIPCFSTKSRRWHYPLKAACLDLGPGSPMVELLIAHGATLKPEDKHLLLTRLT